MGKKLVPQAIGIPWYSEADYGRCMAIFADSLKQFGTFKEWLVKAEEIERALIAEGGKVVRAPINSVTFPMWCSARAITRLDASARSKYASEYARSHAAVRFDGLLR